MSAARRAVRYLLLAGLVLPTACAPGGDAAADEEGDAAAGVRVDISVRRYLGGAVFHLGAVEGDFAAEGVDLHIHPNTTAGDRTLPALDAGHVDVISSSRLIAVLNAIAAGARIKMVAGTGYLSRDNCRFLALVARRGLVSPGTPVTPQTLRGLRIDFNPLSGEGFFIDQFMRTGGLTSDDIERVYLPLAARVEAMERGGIDMTVVAEPWVSRLEADGHVSVLGANEVAQDHQYGVLVFGSRFLEEDREAGRKFVRGYLRAARRFEQGSTPRNVELVSEFTGLPPEMVADICWPTIRPDGNLEWESFMEYQRWAVEQGHLDRVVQPEEFWDPYFTGIEAPSFAPGGGRP